MNTKFTFLAVSFLLTTSIYALGPAHNKSSKLTGSFLKNKLERTAGITKHNPFQRNIALRKQADHLKSAKAVKQRLDSYTYKELEDDGKYEKGKSEFVYNVNGMLTIERGYYWNETTGIMVLESLSETTYDDRKNKIQDVYTYLDETTNQFAIEYKATYSYDNNGNRIQAIYYEPNNDRILIQNYKTEYTYDSNGKLIQLLSSRFDENTKQFVFSDKTDYVFNGNGMETQQIYYYWDSYSSKQWEPNTKYESTYDSQGNLIIYLVSSATNINNTWTWRPIGKLENTYDAKRQLIQILDYDINNNNQWELDNKDVYVYDDKGNNTQSFYYNNWDVQTSQWEGVYKEEYTYDNKYTKNDLILPFDDDEFLIFTHMITEIKGYSWDSSTNGWVTFGETAFAYSPINITSVSQMDAEISTVFPNPCSESVSFNFSDSYSRITFELFDLQGRKLLSKAISSNEKVNMERFRSGLYLYKLNTDGKVQSGKLVKE